MQPAALPPDEFERISRLMALSVLDSPPEVIFDAIARLASDLCGAPIALVSLVDSHRQWFKSNVGLLDATETPRDIAFCAHALLDDYVMEVPDAQQDRRFADNPLVIGDPGIRFYAGAPISLSDGARLGTLCVMDRVPRKLSEQQLLILQRLAGVVAEALEFRERAVSSLAAAAEAQIRLAESEARYKALVEDQSELVSLATPDGILTFVNSAYARQFGRRPQDMVGKSLFDFIAEADRPLVAEHLRTVCVLKGAVEGENQMLSATGQLRWVAWTNRALLDGQGQVKAIHSVGRDITARKQTEQELADERARMARILAGTNAGTWEWNVRTGETLFNERWAEIIGYTLEGLGKSNIQNWRDLTHPDDRVRSAERLQAHLNGESDFYYCESRVRHKNGQWVWVVDRSRVSARAEDGQPLWMHGVRLDVSERKRAEEALRTSQGLLERTGAVAGVGGWEVDLNTGVILWSDETCRLHDVEPGHRPTMDEAIAFYSPEARPVIEKAVREGLELGKPWDLELPLVSAKGRAFWARAVGTVEFDGDKPVRLIGAFQDVTERRRIERALAESHELLQVTLDSIGDAVITTDMHGQVRWLNPVAERLTGWTKEDAQGKPLAQIFVIVDEETRQPAEDRVARCLEHGKTVGFGNHTLLISRDGAEYGIEDSAAPIRDANSEILGAVLVFHDVSEQRRLGQEMKHRATHDALTGLANRGEFEGRLSRLLALTRQEPSSNALMYIDLDHFKLVNDACGHSVGDQLLRQVSSMLQGCVRSRDTVARLGGDEFGLILEQCDIVQAQRIAQKICDQMEDFGFLHGERRFCVGTSIGLVPVDARWTSMVALLQAADTSCYAAKEAGRNRVHIWFDSDSAAITRQGEGQWIARLEKALTEDSFELFAQRIECIDPSAQGLRFEVLLRLHEANGAIILPGAFLPAAERFHLASRIDRWVVRHVFRWLQDAGDTTARIELIAINLCGQSVGDREFHRDLKRMIKEASFDVRKLCFEITETAAVTSLGDSKAFIDELRALGVKIALDDFGSGSSSFGYLKTLAVDFLKIDGRFIVDLLDDPLDDIAVRGFRDVAKVVGAKTIAKFVERAEVRTALRDIGVDMAQGYLLHEPAPLASMSPISGPAL